MNNACILDPDSSAQMDAGELRACQDVLHWTNQDLAKELRCSKSLVRDWTAGPPARGDARRAWVIPAAVAAWLRARAHDALARPAPSGWRIRRGDMQHAAHADL